MSLIHSTLGSTRSVFVTQLLSAASIKSSLLKWAAFSKAGRWQCFSTSCLLGHDLWLQEDRGTSVPVPIMSRCHARAHWCGQGEHDRRQQISAMLGYLLTAVRGQSGRAGGIVPLRRHGRSRHRGSRQNSYQDQFCLFHHLVFRTLQVTGQTTINGESVWQGHTGQGNLEGERQSLRPHLYYFYVLHTHPAAW